MCQPFIVFLSPFIGTICLQAGNPILENPEILGSKPNSIETFLNFYFIFKFKHNK